MDEYPGHLVPRYRVRPATRPVGVGFSHGDDTMRWPTGAFVEAPYCDGWWSGYVISNRGTGRPTIHPTLKASTCGVSSDPSPSMSDCM